MGYFTIKELLKTLLDFTKNPNSALPLLLCKAVKPLLSDEKL